MTVNLSSVVLHLRMEPGSCVGGERGQGWQGASGPEACAARPITYDLHCLCIFSSAVLQGGQYIVLEMLGKVGPLLCAVQSSQLARALAFVVLRTGKPSSFSACSKAMPPPSI